MAEKKRLPAVRALTSLLSLPFPHSGGGLGGGGFGGGGGGSVGLGEPVGANWLPSMDRHAIGESRHFSLIRITSDRSEFCLGCIGSEERWFCQSTACNMVAHKKRCYELACQEGCYIPTEGQRSMRP